MSPVTKVTNLYASASGSVIVILRHLVDFAALIGYKRFVREFIY